MVVGLRLPWEYGDQALRRPASSLQLRYRLDSLHVHLHSIGARTTVPLVGQYLDIPSRKALHVTGVRTCSAMNCWRPRLASRAWKTGAEGRLLAGGEKWLTTLRPNLDGGQACLTSAHRTDAAVCARGSIVPMAPDMEYTDQRPLDPLIVDVYAGKPASFRLYEDDGTSLNYRHGAMPGRRLP